MSLLFQSFPVSFQHPHPQNLPPTIFQNDPSPPEIAPIPAHTKLLPPIAGDHLGDKKGVLRMEICPGDMGEMDNWHMYVYLFIYITFSMDLFYGLWQWEYFIGCDTILWDITIWNTAEYFMGIKGNYWSCPKNPLGVLQIMAMLRGKCITSHQFLGYSCQTTHVYTESTRVFGI